MEKWEKTNQTRTNRREIKMLLNAKQVEAMLTTNGKGEAAQVGYDLTIKKVSMINGGKLLISGTEVDEY
jgi:hypothetical protein